MKVLGLCLLAFVAPSVVYSQQTECKVDIALAIDASGSIWADQAVYAVGEANWQAVRSFTANLVRDFEIGEDGTLVAAALFEDNVSSVFDLSLTDKNEMIRLLLNLFYDLTGGRTKMDLVMQHFYENVFNGDDRQDATNVMVIITDGRITQGHERETMRLVNVMRDEGVRFVAVGITDQANFTQLLEITGDENSVFEVSEFSELEANLERIRDEACVTPPSPSGCPDPVEGMVAFSAYSANSGMILYEDDMVLPFQMTYLNVGEHYDVNTYQFTCECKGLYEFHLTMSGVNPGMMAAIVKENEIVSPIAHTTPSGAMSTTTIIECDADEKVWSKVLHANGIGLMPCMYDGASFHGMTGKMLTTVP